MRLVLAAIAALAICTTSAVGAPSAASPFELVVTGWHEAVPAGPAFPFGTRHTGTFAASQPFCSSGVFWDLTNDLLNSLEDTRLYTCGDGSGTLTTVQEDWFEHKPPFTSDWRIIEGTGRYAGLRGKGTYRGELLAGNDEDLASVLYRCAFSGTVAFDRVAPTIAVSSSKATKLRRPAGAYSLRVEFSVRDSLAENGISYFIAVDAGDGGLYLAKKEGTTTTGEVAITLRITPGVGTRKVVVELRAEDAVGNRRIVTRPLKLPR